MSGVAGIYGKSTLNFLRNYKIVLHRNIILHSCQQCISVLLSLHSHQHLFFSLKKKNYHWHFGECKVIPHCSFEWPQDWKRSVFIPVPKKGNAKECSNYRTVGLISHASKVMLKILQARLQQYVNCALPDVQAGFRKGRGTRDQIANICWIMEKAREFQKNIYFCFIDYAKAFDYVDHNKLWKILKEMGIPEHLICLLRDLCAGQEATFRTGHRTTDWFQIRKRVRQGCILSSCLFNYYAE